ncbi:AI-2E family transporter [Fibrella aquatica]|uniref:AI-2E family transporter n=1 Tax=Fibrella aquatica TaxID=3242487 RepID=UPI0035208543
MNTSNESPVDHRVFVQRVCIAVGITLFFIGLIWLLGSSFNVLLLLLAGVLIALPLRAAARWISHKTRWSVGLSLGVVGLLLLGLLTGVGTLVAPQIGEQITQLQEELPKVLQNAKKQLEQSSIGRQLVDQLPDSPQQLVKDGGGSKLANRAFGVASTTFGALADFYIVFFISLFLAAQPTLYVDGIVGLVPPAGRQRARHILDKLGTSLLGWLAGTVMSMSIVGILSGLGLWLLDVRLAGILALFAALITFIPNLGPILALIPAVLFALLDGPQQALYVIILYVTIQAVESNIITPIIQKRLNDIPPALLLVVQVVIGAFAGTLGLVMAAPLLVITMVLVKTLYQEDMLGDKAS